MAADRSRHANAAGDEPDSLSRVHRCLVLGQHDQRRPRLIQPRVHPARHLDPARQRQPDVHAIRHLVGVNAVEEALHEFGWCEPDVHEDGFGPFVESLDMFTVS